MGESGAQTRPNRPRDCRSIIAWPHSAGAAQNSLARRSQIPFCDGSVHLISYTIDPPTHERLARRNDGLPIDAGKYWSLARLLAASKAVKGLGIRY